jgi:hypothetical protein
MHAYHDRRRRPAPQSTADARPGTPIAAGRVAAGRGRRRLLTRRGPAGLLPMMLLAGFGTPPSALPVPVLAGWPGPLPAGFGTPPSALPAPVLAGVSTPPAGAVAVLLAWLTILLMTASGALPVPVLVAPATPPSALVAWVLVGASTQPSARPIPVPVGVGTPTQARPVPVLAGGDAPRPPLGVAGARRAVVGVAALRQRPAYLLRLGVQGDSGIAVRHR